MQEKKILPRRKGVVLLSVLGCLFVFFAKTEKDLGSCRPQDVSRRCQVFFCFCKKYKQTSQNTQQYNAFASGKNFLFLHITTLYAPDAPHGRDSGDIQNLSGPWPP